MADASISAEPENIRFSAVACHTEGVVRNCHPKEAGSQMTWNSMDDVVCCHAVASVAANHDKLGQGSYGQTGIRQEFHSITKKPFRPFLSDLAPFETHRTLQQKACHKAVPFAFCNGTHAYKARGSLAFMAQLSCSFGSLSFASKGASMQRL